MVLGLKNLMVSDRLGKALEMCFTPNGTSVADFSIACDHSWISAEGQKHTESKWSNVVARNSLAEITKEYLDTGSLADIEGRLQSRTWQDKEGQHQRSFEIVAPHLLLLNNQQIHDHMKDQVEFEDYLY
jgi:single-strand DNA-binding protein